MIVVLFDEKYSVLQRLPLLSYSKIVVFKIRRTLENMYIHGIDTYTSDVFKQN